jgi:hypothetical protein
MSETPDPPHEPHEPHGLEFGPSDENIAKQLADYKKALEQEYQTNTAQAELDAQNNPAKHTKQFFLANLPHAAAQVVWLSGNSTSDSTRLSASKFIIQMAIEDTKQEHDPIKDLFSELMKNDTPRDQKAKTHS